MTLEIPKLDDRRYADLVEEALGMLPRVAPEWTDHNPSDPGITLVELMAWFSEMLLFRLDRISRETKLRFLDLLKGPAWDGRQALAQASPGRIDTALRQAAQALREPERAVTAADYQYLARRATRDAPSGHRVLRALCAPDRDLEADAAAWETERPGHFSLVLVPEPGTDGAALQALTKAVRGYLEPRRLLGTRLHVVGPRYLQVEVGGCIRIRRGAEPARVRAAGAAALAQFFSPLPGGGPESEGWPFGRPVHLAEIYALLDGVPGVDWVEELHLLTLSFGNGSDGGHRLGIQVGRVAAVGEETRLGAVPALGPDRLLRDDRGQLSSVALRPYELADVRMREEEWRIVD
jgi:hypothetical protein